MDYMTAYLQRLERNNETFLSLIKELKEMGCTVFAPKDKLINFIKVFRDNRHIILSFNEVPYHWRLEMCLKPSIEYGSGRTIESNDSDENTFTASYIVSKMVQNPDVKDFKNPYYLMEIKQTA